VLLNDVGEGEEVLDDAATQNLALVIIAIVILIVLCVCISICMTKLGKQKKPENTMHDDIPIACVTADVEGVPREDVDGPVARITTEDLLPTILSGKSRSTSQEEDRYLSKADHTQSSATPSTDHGIDAQTAAAAASGQLLESAPIQDQALAQDTEACRAIHLPRCTHRSHWLQHNIGTKVLLNARIAALDAVQASAIEGFDHQVQKETFAEQV